MGNPDRDLWSEFSEKEGVTDDFTGKLPPIPKSTETDGSEWAGKFDRRLTTRDLTTRDENPDTDGGTESDS